MTELTLKIKLTIDENLIHGEDPDAVAWFNQILFGDDVSLFAGGDWGDEIGPVKVLEIMNRRENVKRATES